MEPEVLSTAWAKLSDASRETELMTPPQDTLNLSGMEDMPIKILLKKEYWKESDIKQLITMKYRNSAYIEHATHRKCEAVNLAIINFYDYLNKNRIFITGEIKESFLEASPLLKDTLISYTDNHGKIS